MPPAAAANYGPATSMTAAATSTASTTPLDRSHNATYASMTMGTSNNAAGGNIAANSNPSSSLNIANRSSGYFPPQLSQLHPQPSPLASVNDDPTLSNTLVNSSHHANHNLATPSSSPPDAALSPATLAVPENRGKFTEEWDASQRGSSIIDGSAMHRSNSVHSALSYATGDEHVPSRGNTLKKKPSLRRGGSLKRSSSRRSMKAGSVRSLALQSASDPDESHSAFHCPVPTSGTPTEVLATRFQGS
jgi:hypothetical protein